MQFSEHGRVAYHMKGGRVEQFEYRNYALGCSCLGRRGGGSKNYDLANISYMTQLRKRHTVARHQLHNLVSLDN